MEEKKFNCKNENLPVIGGFLLTSFVKDKQQFVSYSQVYDDPFEATFREKQSSCAEMVTTEYLLMQQKAINAQLGNKIVALRPVMNSIEGYLKLASESLDIGVSDFGLKSVRDGIGTKSPEVTMSGLKMLLANLNRNATVLQAKGYKPETAAALATTIAEINVLNEQQNELKNKRSRTADEAMKEYNALWNIMAMVLSAGKAIFRGVDEVKLREYTFSSIRKRVQNATNPDDKEEEEADSTVSKNG